MTPPLRPSTPVEPIEQVRVTLSSNRWSSRSSSCPATFSHSFPAHLACPVEIPITRSSATAFDRRGANQNGCFSSGCRPELTLVRCGMSLRRPIRHLRIVSLLPTSPPRPSFLDRSFIPMPPVSSPSSHRMGTEKRSRDGPATPTSWACSSAPLPTNSMENMTFRPSVSVSSTHSPHPQTWGDNGSRVLVPHGLLEQILVQIVSPPKWNKIIFACTQVRCQVGRLYAK
ncbi:unnamed protein product [Discosporangium mesarthrocarpum]